MEVGPSHGHQAVPLCQLALSRLQLNFCFASNWHLFHYVHIFSIELKLLNRLLFIPSLSWPVLELYNSINFKYKYIFQGKMFHFNLKWNIILRYIKLSSPQLNNIAIIGKNSTNSRFVTSISLVGRRVTFSFVSSFERRLISTAVLSLFKKQDKSEKRNIPYLRYQYYKNKFDKSRT